MTERVKLPLSRWIVVLAELLALGYLIRTEDLTPSGLLLLSLIGAVALFALDLNRLAVRGCGGSDRD